jgi:primosomal protein N' (replication factor Y)
MVCEECGTNDLQTMKFGTEKLEETLRSMFRDANIQRMDLDTTRSKRSYQQIIDAFEEHEIDILVGTQMVSKGLDFNDVDLVGIFDTDRMMHFPDFRASERTFQLITQVSGRAGRRENPGRVVIQTSDPDHLLIRRIVNHDFIGFYNREITERRLFHYPPFVRLINLTIRPLSREECKRAALMLEKDLRQRLSPKMLVGPQEALIPRIRNQYHWQLLIKMGKHKVDLARVKLIVKESASNLLRNKSHKGTSIIFDVDPA